MCDVGAFEVQPQARCLEIVQSAFPRRDRSRAAWWTVWAIAFGVTLERLIVANRDPDIGSAQELRIDRRPPFERVSEIR